MPVVASYHTRYDTYLRFYGLGLFEKLGQRYMRNFYNRVRRVYPPSESMAEIIRREGQSQNVEIWARGVDSDLFSPAKRDMAWRRSLGIADDEVAISFAGRLVKEKNTAIFMRVLNALTAKGLKVKPLVIGDGPEMAAMKAGPEERRVRGLPPRRGAGARLCLLRHLLLSERERDLRQRDAGGHGERPSRRERHRQRQQFAGRRKV